MTQKPLTERRLIDLILAIGLVDLDDRERRFLEWLAGMDRPTVDAALGLIGEVDPTTILLVGAAVWLLLATACRP